MPSQGMSKIAISHAVVLVAERRWRIMRGTRTSVIATPAIIDKCETITEMSVRFVKPNLRLLNLARSLRRACRYPANVMSVLANVQFSRRDEDTRRLQAHWPILMPHRRWRRAHAGSRKPPRSEGC